MKYLPLDVEQQTIIQYSKFKDLPNEAKFIWHFTNEDISVLKLLGKYIIGCLDIRRGDYCYHK